VRIGPTAELVVCDQRTLALRAPLPVPSFGGPILTPATLVPSGASRFAIVTADKLILLDPAEF
jgi:hypothetical protein